MRGRLWILAILSITLMLSGGAIAAERPETMSSLLMPPSQLDATATVDIDWQIDGENPPDTPFEKAIAPRLAPLGITGTISATYERPDTPAALISFEAYRYESAPNTLEALDALKPGLLAKAERATTTIHGHKAQVFSLPGRGPMLHAIAVDQLLFVVGAPDPSAADVPGFLNRYFTWREFSSN